MPELRRLVSELEAAVDRGLDEAEAWLATPRGRALRSAVARGLLLATPVILRHPFFKTPVGRLVEVAGAAALVAKVATTIRDWEPVSATDPAG